MFKRAIILVVLSAILFTLVIVKNHTANPVNKTVSNDTASTEYITKEYTISKIKGSHYYGKNENGTGIRFSDKSIVSGDNINVNDVVVCYFEKDNLGKGIIKVEKK